MKKFSIKKMFLYSSFSILSSFLFSACNQQSDRNNVQTNPIDHTENLRPITASERAADFDQLISFFKSYYGPYQYKEQRFNISIDSVAQELKKQAITSQTDEEFAGYVMQLGATLHDGHIQISVPNTSSGISHISIPILLTPVEDKALIGSIDAELEKTFDLQVGDEVLEVDGKTVFSYLPLIMKYNSWANDKSNQHLIYQVLSRRSFLIDLKPSKSTAILKVLKKNGTIVVKEIPWTTRRYNKDLANLYTEQLNFSVPAANDINSVVKGTIDQMGDINPFFITPETQKKFSFIKVYPSVDSKKIFGLEENRTPKIYAALYKYNGKTILLVRQPGYYPQDYTYVDYLKAYRALFSEYENLVDLMIIDQTHNPGGNGAYCSGFFNLISKEGDVEGVQMCRADRKWINELTINDPQDPSMPPWDAKLSESFGLIIEAAYDKGEFLSPPLSIFNGSNYVTKQEYRWNKPVLVLIDELAGSCGDVFPMLVKANKRAILFGQTTMGLGGSVEHVGILSNSQIKIHLTRGLFMAYRPDGQYSEENYVENNGIAPDIFYSHTVNDFRAGFVHYVTTFSDEAVKLVK